MSFKSTLSIFFAISALVLILSFNAKPAGNAHAGGIKWMTMQEAIDANKVKPKKVLVDIYTDWCGWCKRMDKDTYENQEVIDYINKNFYAVKFNAEKSGDIKYKDRVFKMPDVGGRATHEFTFVMMQPGGGYPTTCFFDDEMNVLQSIPGYQDPKTMKMIAKYFGDNYYKNTDWTKYQSTYKP